MKCGVILNSHFCTHVDPVEPGEEGHREVAAHDGSGGRHSSFFASPPLAW